MKKRKYRFSTFSVVDFDEGPGCIIIYRAEYREDAARNERRTVGHHSSEQSV